jgi:protein TonB
MKRAPSVSAAGREKVVQRSAPVGENVPVRIEYVAPKFPSSVRNRGVTGWVELEFTVLEDGSTADVVVTNSSPRRTFDNAAMTAIGQWRYKPVVARDGKIVQQRVAVRIRFSDE